MVIAIMLRYWLLDQSSVAERIPEETEELRPWRLLDVLCCACRVSPPSLPKWGMCVRAYARARARVRVCVCVCVCVRACARARVCV